MAFWQWGHWHICLYCASLADLTVLFSWKRRPFDALDSVCAVARLHNHRSWDLCFYSLLVDWARELSPILPDLPYCETQACSTSVSILHYLIGAVTSAKARSYLFCVDLQAWTSVGLLSRRPSLGYRQNAWPIQTCYAKITSLQRLNASAPRCRLAQ